MSKFSNNAIFSNCPSVRTKIQRFPKKLKFLSLRLTGRSCATTEIRDVCRLKPHLHYRKKWVPTHRKVGTDQIFLLCKPSVSCFHEMDPDSLFSGFGAIGGYGPKTEKKTSPDPFRCSKALCKRIVVPYHLLHLSLPCFTVVSRLCTMHFSIISLTCLLPV